MSSSDNYGISTVGGGTTNIYGPTAVGPYASVHTSDVRQRNAPAWHGGMGTDIGIITVLTEETQAIRRALSLEPDQTTAPSFDVGDLKVSGRTVTVATTQALAQGEGSTMSAFHQLRERYKPNVIVLAGIAGGIHRGVRIADVVIATRVVYYDLRKETPVGTIRRGQERQAPAEILRAVNRFFVDNGEPAELPDETSGGTFRALSGPIGSGNAVVADRDSEILTYLAGFNDKILAVDMEAGGLSQAHYEQSGTIRRPRGWLVVRGISDLAGRDKNDDHHHHAAWSAAVVLRKLIPYLLLVPAEADA